MSTKKVNQKKKEFSVERAIVAFFIGFSMIGFASFIFFFGVMFGKDVDTTETFKVVQPSAVVEQVKEDTTKDPITEATQTLKNAVEDVSDKVTDKGSASDDTE